jgi:hypothetical protein
MYLTQGSLSIIYQALAVLHYAALASAIAYIIYIKRSYNMHVISQASILQQIMVFKETKKNKNTIWIAIIATLITTVWSHIIPIGMTNIWNQQWGYLPAQSIQYAAKSSAQGRNFLNGSITPLPNLKYDGTSDEYDKWICASIVGCGFGSGLQNYTINQVPDYGFSAVTLETSNITIITDIGIQATLFIGSGATAMSQICQGENCAFTMQSSNSDGSIIYTTSIGNESSVTLLSSTASTPM